MIELSTELGAIASNATPQVQNHLKRIGHYIGMSFQIMDDILDFTSTERKLGKPVGSDLLNGHITLPVLLEMRQNATFRDTILTLHAGSDMATFEYCIDTVRHSTSIDAARQVSQKYLDKALALLDTLNDQEAKQLFKKLIDKMSNRKH